MESYFGLRNCDIDFFIFRYCQVKNFQIWTSPNETKILQKTLEIIESKSDN